jgi:hypothetical protein
MAVIRWDHLLLIQNFCTMIGAYMHGKLYDKDHSLFGYKQYKDLSYETKKCVWQRGIYGFC